MRIALAAVLAAAAGLARAADWGPLVTPAELAARPEALVLDLRAGEPEGFIPGAVRAPYALWRGPAENPGEHPDPERLTGIMRAAGVRLDRPVAVAHGGEDRDGFGAAAWVYWALKSAGHPRPAILNGGHAAWVAAGLPIEPAPAEPVPSEVTVVWSDAWTASRAEVAAAEAGETGAVLVDARPEAFFRGLRRHNAAAEPGTLFGAVNLVFDLWFRPDATTLAMSDAALARARALAAQAQGETIVSFCNTGHWSAINWFALSELAGVEGVKLYPESVVGWSRAGLPLSPGG